MRSIVRLPALPLTLLSLPVLALAVFLLVARGRSAESAAAAEPPGTMTVVELFTSQGCSSCPPADRLLTRIASDPRYRGKVVPLSFHVDYWNHIGWTDPFSSPRWSERQRAYGRQAFRSGRIYTPQVVVDGRSELVGSNEQALRAQIDAALERGADTRVSLEVGKPAAGRLALRAGAQVLRAAGAGELGLWIAVYERALVTRVGAGENAAATLRNDHVVRHLQRVLTLPAAPGAPRWAELAVPIDPRWKRPDLGVAAFVQHPGSLAIHGAIAREVPPG